MSNYRLSKTITISAPPDEVYDAIADVSRMGEFSPVCKGGEWDEGVAIAARGAWFTGHNSTTERDWSTRCLIESAHRGERFEFVNHGSDGRMPLVRWTYALAPAGDGTEVTETWEVLENYEAFIHERAPGLDVAQMLDGTKAATGPGMEATLAALKEVCEA